MRKVIAFMHMSLDGFVSRPNGEMDWVTTKDEDIGKYLIGDLFTTMDTMLLGRNLYQGFEQYWPGVTTNPNAPAQMAEFARWIEDSRKIVFSSRQQQFTWQHSELVVVKNDQEIATTVHRLKQQPGANMVVFGGARMAQTLVQLNLIDEYRIKMEPVVLGKGAPLFTSLENKMNLQLVRSKAFSSGVVALHYEPVR